jgi:hypothetical protein
VGVLVTGASLVAPGSPAFGSQGGAAATCAARDVVQHTLVRSAGSVTENFRLAAACEVALVSYAAPTASFDPQLVGEQVLFDARTATLPPGGPYSLTVALPEAGACFFQVDFVRGNVRQDLAPGHDYARRWLDTLTGGEHRCAPQPSSTTTTTLAVSPSSTVPTTTTTTLAVSPSSTVAPSTTSTTVAAAPRAGGPVVLGSTIQRSPAVAGAQQTRGLATTGTQARTESLLGAVALALGGLTVAAGEARRSSGH